MPKSTDIHHPIHELIRNRRSIRAFSPDAVDQEKINSLFEATRWAPSSTNEQPWVYIYATRDQVDLWDKMFEALDEGNKLWAKDAPLMILSLARKEFTRYEGPNAHALYDLGGANAFLSLQAVELGLQVRQMAGYNASIAKHNFNIPDEYILGVFIAVGYPGDPGVLPDKLRKRETAPRERYLQDVFVLNRSF